MKGRTFTLALVVLILIAGGAAPQAQAQATAVQSSRFSDLEVKQSAANSKLLPRLVRDGGIRSFRGFPAPAGASSGGPRRQPWEHGQARSPAPAGASDTSFYSTTKRGSYSIR